MPTLPFEILTLTFQYLEKNDILQCQLTSKKWYEASVNLLYSHIEVYTSERSRLYGRTISNSLHLGAHLKTIYTQQLFKTKKEDKLWDEHDLLNKIMRHCPNLLRLYSLGEDKAFWLRVSHGASRGYLSHLQILPASGFRNLEHYIHAALHFKASLTDLVIRDTRFTITDLNGLEIYQDLLDQIGDFKKLQNIVLIYHSNKQLSCFDSVIDNCPNLKELYFRLFSTEQQRAIVEHQEILIPSPRPDIRLLECFWDTISTEKQIQYIAHKFPNLQSLTVRSVYYSKLFAPRSCPRHILIDFLRYATALPEFDIRIPLTYQELPNVMTELIQMKDIYGDIIISFAYSIPNVNGPLLKIKTRTLKIEFPFPKGNNNYPWAKFFVETGNKIRSITVVDECFSSSFFDSIPYETTIDSGVLLSMRTIFEIIRACPLLEEFTMDLSAYHRLSSESRILEVTHVEKLTVRSLLFTSDCQLSFLRLMSQKLPNLRQLRLVFNEDTYNPYEIDEPYIIYMKKTRLDLLTWTCKNPYYIIDSSFVAYFKLKTTNNPQRFYIGNKTGLFPILKTQYNNPVRYNAICFDITCQALKEVRITAKSTPSLTLRWFF